MGKLMAFFLNPMPHALLGGACAVLALAQDEPMVMLVGAASIWVGILTVVERA